MNDKTKSLILDLVQISCLIYLLLTGPLFSPYFLNIFLQIIALVLMLSAVWEMRRNKFYRVPDTGKQDRLISGGIFRYIRHPMYTSEILFALTLLGNYFSLVRLVIYFIFSINFLFKIQYEEKLLQKHFSDYSEYKKQSFKLLPFLY